MSLKRYGSYENFYPIGQGGMADVYKATEAHSGQIVALKTLKDNLSRKQRAEYSLRLRKEGELLKTLSHNNIVKFISQGVEKGTPWVALEYIEGQSLKDVIRQRNFLELGDFLNYAIQLVEALIYLQECSIVHRDLKPQNILVVSQFGRETVKLIDFSLSTFSRDVLNESTFVSNEHLMGTLAYSAPEQCVYLEKKVDIRADFYSLGVVFYEMLSGRLPHNVESNESIIQAHLTKAPISLKKRNISVPHFLESMVLKLLSGRRERRYQSAKGILEDLLILKSAYQSESLNNLPKAVGQHDYNVEVSFEDVFHVREKQKAQLMHSLKLVITGTPMFTVIEGSWGTGKSTLASYLRVEAINKHFMTMQEKISLSNRKNGLQAIYSSMESSLYRFLRLSLENRQHLKGSLGDVCRRYPWLLKNLALPSLVKLMEGDEKTEGEGEESPEVEVDAHEEVEGLVKLACVLSRVSHYQGLLLILEDCYWLNNKLERYLIHLIEYAQEEDYSIFILITSDTERRGVYSPDQRIGQTLLEKNIFYHKVKVSDFNFHDLKGFIQSCFHEKFSVTGDFYRELYIMTSGNPFFVKSVLQQLVTMGVIRKDPDSQRWELFNFALAELSIPNSCVDLVVRRLQKFSEDEIKVLVCAAYLEGAFGFETLQAILVTADRSLLDATLLKATEHWILRQDSNGYYFFPHVRILDTLKDLGVEASFNSVHQDFFRYLSSENKKHNYFNLNAEDGFVEAVHRKRSERIEVSLLDKGNLIQGFTESQAGRFIRKQAFHGYLGFADTSVKEVFQCCWLAARFSTYSGNTLESVEFFEKCLELYRLHRELFSPWVIIGLKLEMAESLLNLGRVVEAFDVLDETQEYILLNVKFAQSKLLLRVCELECRAVCLGKPFALGGRSTQIFQAMEIARSLLNELVAKQKSQKSQLSPKGKRLMGVGSQPGLNVPSVSSYPFSNSWLQVSVQLLFEEYYWRGNVQSAHLLLRLWQVNHISFDDLNLSLLWVIWEADYISDETETKAQTLIKGILKRISAQTEHLQSESATIWLELIRFTEESLDQSVASMQWGLKDVLVLLNNRVAKGDLYCSIILFQKVSQLKFLLGDWEGSKRAIDEAAKIAEKTQSKHLHLRCLAYQAVIFAFKDRIKSHSIINKLEEGKESHLISYYVRVAKLFSSLNAHPLEKGKAPLALFLTRRKGISNRFMLSDAFLCLGYLAGIVTVTAQKSAIPQREIKREIKSYCTFNKKGNFYSVMSEFLRLLLPQKSSTHFSVIDRETQKGQAPIVLAFFSLGLARKKLCRGKQQAVRWKVAEGVCHLKQAKDSYYSCMMQESAYNIIQLMEELEGGSQAVKSAYTANSKGTSISLRRVGYDTLLEFPSRLSTYNSIEEAAYGALQTVINVTSGDRGLVLLREHSNGMLCIKAIHGFVLPTPSSQVLNLNEIELEAHKKEFQICWSGLERAVREKTYVIIGRETQDVSIKQQHSFLSSDMCSMLALPIMWRNQLYGVIYLDSSHNPYMASVHPIALFQSFAMQFALYYENLLLLRGQKLVSHENGLAQPKKRKPAQADAA